MGNNNEIRQRMETYRKVLLAVVWIVGIVGIIAGLAMIGYEKKSGGGWYSSTSTPLRPFGIALLIVSILESIIGHFLVNVGLAIPFILLNNGDYLATIAGTPSSGNSSGLNLSNVAPTNPNIVNSGDSWVCKKCNERNPNTSSSCKGCGAYK